MISDIHPSKKTISPSSYQDKGDLNGRKFSTSVEQQPLIEILQRHPEVFFFNDHISRLPLKDQVLFASISKVSRGGILEMIFQKHFPTVRYPEGKFNEFYSNFIKAVDDLVKGDWEAFLKTDIDPTARSLAAKRASNIAGKFNENCEGIILNYNSPNTEHLKVAITNKFPREEIRIEIAKIAADREGDGSSKCIRCYGISDERARIEIAKIAAHRDGKNTSKYIRNYEIADKSARIEIAKIAAHQNGLGTSAYIQNYGITDESAIDDIVKIVNAARGT